MGDHLTVSIQGTIPALVWVGFLTSLVTIGIFIGHYASILFWK